MFQMKTNKKIKNDWMKIEKQLRAMIEDNEAIADMRWLDEILIQVNKEKAIEQIDSFITYYINTVTDITALHLQALSEEKYEICGLTQQLLKLEYEDVIERIMLIYGITDNEEDMDIKDDLLAHCTQVKLEMQSKITKFINLLTNAN